MKDIENILTQYGISLETFKRMTKHLKPLILKKGEVFIQSGKRNSKIGILLNGLLTATYISEKGKEEVSRFYYTSKNFIISNHESFFYDKYSTETIKANEESQIYVIEKNELLNIYKTNSDFEKIGRVLAEESYISAINRIHELQSLTGKERVEKFVIHNKELLNKVNKQDIASYLGINRNDYSKYLSEV